MAVLNQVGNALTGSTGTGAFVGETSPTLVTPIIGAASATSVAFTSTSGIIGTTTNDDAAAGSVGQLTQAIIGSGGATVSLTTATAADVVSISLTAGDWDVWGNVCFGGNAATNVTLLKGWISLTSATSPDLSLTAQHIYAGGTVPFAISSICFTVPPLRVSVAGTTTVYLGVRSSFTVSTAVAYGGIYARRRR